MIPEPPPTEKLPERPRLITGGAGIAPRASGLAPMASAGQGAKEISTGWYLLLAGLLVGCIPGFGFVVYLLALPLLVVAFILGIVGITKGRTAGGICLLLATMILAPIAYLLAPLISTALLGGG